MELHTHTFLQGGKYRIEKVLGQGGFGITYLGTQVALNRKVAIKEFFMKEYCNRDEATSRVSVPSEGSKELVAKFKTKFIKEAQTIAEMDNQHIIRIHDVFEENGTAYYVMEYLQGGDLSHKISSKGIPETEALEYIRQVGEALSYIHAKNILHLDIKPTNILFRENGDVVLIDFGVSKHYDDTSGSQTSSTPVGISEGYAPTEQYDREAIASFAPSTDVYSLGATLYCLLCGTRPPKASVVLNEGLPALPSKVSDSTRKAVEKAMAPRRKDRPQSVKGFLALLDDEVTIVEPKIEPKKTPKATITPTPNPFKKWIIPLAACVVVALAIILWPKNKAIENVEIVAQQIPTKADSIVTDSVIVEEAAPTPSLFYVTTSPTDATIYIDGKKVGTSPIENKEISRGTHTVKISKKGYETITEKLDFGDKPVVLNKTLTEIKQNPVQTNQADQTKEKTITFSSSGTINGHQYVDLGLSVKWADRNIGASSIKDLGKQYAWGETSIKTNFIEENSITYGKEQNDISGNAQFDVARAEWKDNWRLPTETEVNELLDKCTITWGIYENMEGIIITGPNGNSIFLPAAGRAEEFSTHKFAGVNGEYWTSTPFPYLDNIYAKALWFSNATDKLKIHCNSAERFYGYSIRPVINK